MTTTTTTRDVRCQQCTEQLLLDEEQHDVNDDDDQEQMSVTEGRRKSRRRRRRRNTDHQNNWEEMYEQLEQFVERHGHAHVPIRYSANDVPLGRWVDKQRYYYRRQQQQQRGGRETEFSSMTLERYQKLQDVGMVWDVRDDTWEGNYEALLEFYYTYGHVHVPQRHCSNIGKRRLGRWVYRQRRLYELRQQHQRGGQEGTTTTQLTTERLVKLSALGMVWSIPEAAWNESYRQLVDFHRKHGHSNVPTDAKDGLARWVNIQRREYKHGRMSQERMDRLSQLKFEWDYQDAMWLEKYDELCEYRREYGTTIVPKTFESNPSLGRWVGQQREQYKKFQDGKSACITPRRIELLEQIDFVWNAIDAQWRQRLDELKEIVEVNGYGSVPPTKTNRSLHGWLRRQEQAYRKMRNGEKVAMTEERAAELQKLGFLLDEDN